MLHIFAVIIIGLIIGSIAGALTSRSLPVSGWIGTLFAGLIGSWLGESILGSWGLTIAGIAIFPSIIGAMLLVIIVSMFMRAVNKNKRYTLKSIKDTTTKDFITIIGGNTNE